MKFNYRGYLSITVMAAAVAAAGCEVQSGLPTGASSLHSTTGNGLSDPLNPLASEKTDCPNLKEFRLRTTSPGSIEGNVVRAWIKLVGAPADATSIRVWWNYNDGVSEDYRLDELFVTVNEDGTINVALLAEHTYPEVSEETAFAIRAELVVGKDGTHCARVRHITVTPPEEEPVEKKPGPCQLFGSGKASNLGC